MTIIRVVDFETTGMELPAQVCEVGLCDLNLETREIGSPRSWLCGVDSMPPEVRAIHHIQLADCAGLAPFDPASILTTPCDAIASHMAEFEGKFWQPSAPVICTYKAALRVWPDAPSHSNGALRYWLEDQGLISLDSATAMPSHRAGPDAYVTAHILLALFDAGHTGKEMTGWTKQPRVLPKCTIGKFRGKPWSEVEGGFLSWMVRQDDMEADLKWNAQRELDRRGG